MENTAAKLGRPLLYEEPLERIQLLVRRDTHKRAKKLAKERKVSISTIYREWIDGR